jgi:hypothetical protein
MRCPIVKRAIASKKYAVRYPHHYPPKLAFFGAYFVALFNRFNT